MRAKGTGGVRAMKSLVGLVLAYVVLALAMMLAVGRGLLDRRNSMVAAT